MSIDLIIIRHEEKQKVEGIVSGSDEDKKVDLTNGGKVRSFENGMKNIRHYPHHSHLHMIHSDFKRTRTTADFMLQGAHYKINDSGLVSVAEREDINVGGGIDWVAPEMPAYSDFGEAGDNYRKVLFTDFYKPHEGRKDLLVMSRFIYSMLDATIEGILECMEKAGADGKKNGLLLIAGHTPLVDGLGNVLYGSLIVDQYGNPRVENFPGPFRVGESVKGTIPMIAGDPKIEFNVKHKKVEYALSHLIKMRDFHKQFSE